MHIQRNNDKAQEQNLQVVMQWVHEGWVDWLKKQQL